MNTIALGAFIICNIVGLIVVIVKRSEKNWTGDHYVNSWGESLQTGGITAVLMCAVVLLVWGFVAFPISAYNDNSCKREADGYGLDYDWSIRNGCRMELPTGQLVPSDKIRITSEGDILAGEG